MSVLKNKRGESKAEFVNVASRIYVDTLRFLTRLSNRYSRLIATDIAHLASDVVNKAEMANSIFPADDTRKVLREQYLLEARASLMALDMQLSHCYSLLAQNPNGCFETSSRKLLEAGEAQRKLDKMAENLGCLIDSEKHLLKQVLKSDKKR